MSAEGLKEKFMIQPDVEDRPMTDEELDELLEGFEGDAKRLVKGKRKMIIKNGQRIFVPMEDKAGVRTERRTEVMKRYGTRPRNWT